MTDRVASRLVAQVSKTLKDNQRFIVYGFFIAGYAIMGITLIGLFFKPEFWINCIWMIVLALVLGFIGMTIECDRLEYKLSQK